MTDDETSLARCRTEIEALHVFFEEWLGGTCPESEDAFAQLPRSLAPGFEIITPGGRRRGRDELLNGLRERYGHAPGLTIDIRDVRLRCGGETWVVATYEEWQERPDETDGRLSSVVFRQDEEGPNGLRWCHVHETWLQAPGEE